MSGRAAAEPPYYLAGFARERICESEIPACHILHGFCLPPFLSANPKFACTGERIIQKKNHEFGQAGIQLDSSPILPRRRVHDKCTRARNPASYAGYTLVRTAFSWVTLQISQNLFFTTSESLSKFTVFVQTFLFFTRDYF